MVLEKKNIDLIKKSIEDYNNYSKKEKDTLVDSIEMFWLNAGIQKKKKDVLPVNSKNEQIVRIRQLLAAAWSEDLKD
jgi:hypothetical protein